ncbi:MAG TPA: TM1266 family iron-only hydrogenase system putative regulator [Desulfomonilia bacterium]|jgi:putative iron-only hydrogenase system regulator|nr:iron-only hydrogenase system regulator [Thermodesulfobacteriota bacterium]HWR68284.1 TM1266 family iron-only hydrogenase system putative regulator [Desulfomonilia bacterium]
MEEKSRRIGVVSIIIHKRIESAMKVNEIITQYGDTIIGRMGIPYDPKGIHIIALIIHGTTDDIGALTGKLGNLPDVEVKTVLTKA